MIIDFILMAATLLLALPIALVALETAAAICCRLLHRAPPAGPKLFMPRPRIAVLIPANNEELALARTLASVLPQLATDDRLVVIADNCTDRTATIARSAGAEVVERNSMKEQGKGYALAAGIEYLRAAAPDVLVIVDADMHVAAGSIECLARDATTHNAPIQAVDVLDSPHGASTRVQVSALAFTFKNLVRGLGADMLGIPCFLRGTGMAFPWHLIGNAPLATDNIVEDMQLGVDLAIAGTAPRFCAAARVSGRMPDKTAAASVQRTRWEHGHLQTILHNVPALMWQGIRQRRPGLLALACDLAVPPLALLVIAWCLLAAVAVVANRFGVASIWPLVLLLAVGGLMGMTILAGWSVFGRNVLPARALLSVPGYVLWKVPLYLAFLVKRQQTWIRTERVS